jgi:hypothetical protein
VTLSIFSHFRSAYLRYLSKPQSNRVVYRAMFRSRAKNILELGVGDGQRALRMMEIAKMISLGDEIRYVGMDLFEGRSESDGPGMSFKAAHQCLRVDGVRVQLLPGEPAATLARMANSLGKMDVVVLPAKLDSPDFNRMWLFMPRILHENSQVFIERVLDDGRARLELMPKARISELAAPGACRRAA